MYSPRWVRDCDSPLLSPHDDFTKTMPCCLMAASGTSRKYIKSLLSQGIVDILRRQRSSVRDPKETFNSTCRGKGIPGPGHLQELVALPPSGTCLASARHSSACWRYSDAFFTARILVGRIHERCGRPVCRAPLRLNKGGVAIPHAKRAALWIGSGGRAQSTAKPGTGVPGMTAMEIVRHWPVARNIRLRVPVGQLQEG
jgi:hypothetical protein